MYILLSSFDSSKLHFIDRDTLCLQSPIDASLLCDPSVLLRVSFPQLDGATVNIEPFERNERNR